MRDYQRDALGQIERLADYINAVDAAPGPDDDILPADIAIELLRMRSELTRTLMDERKALLSECADSEKRGHPSPVVTTARIRAILADTPEPKGEVT